MTRGEAHQTKVHYKGKDDDFVVLVDDAKSARDWKTDKSIPLTRVVNSFQGKFDAPSHLTLENEFGTYDEEAVIKQILENDTLQESEGAEREGSKNDSIGARTAH